MTDINPELYLKSAYQAMQKSTDPSNNVGAVIVNYDSLIGTGWNAFPPGVTVTEQRRTERPEKYKFFAHAERSAIYEAAKDGSSTHGAVMYAPWASCCDCARGIILSGIETLVVHKERMDLTPERWKDDIDLALTMIREGGVTVLHYSGPIKGKPVLVNGQLWSPETLEFTGE